MPSVFRFLHLGVLGFSGLRHASYFNFHSHDQIFDFRIHSASVALLKHMRWTRRCLEAKNANSSPHHTACNSGLPPQTNNCNFLLKLFFNSSVWEILFLPSSGLFTFLNLNNNVSVSPVLLGAREGPRWSALFCHAWHGRDVDCRLALSLSLPWIKVACPLSRTTSAATSCLSFLRSFLHTAVRLTFPKESLLFPAPSSKPFNIFPSLYDKIQAWIFNEKWE